MKTIEGGVCAAKGFKANGLNAGIKSNAKKDMAMVYSEAPCVKAGTFTQNKAAAAPVKWDKKVVFESKFAQAIVVNTGIANACTGAKGYEDCVAEAKLVGDILGIPADSVIVSSTGVIGKTLNMDVIEAGIKALPAGLAHSVEAASTAAESIMTTDTVSKQVAVSVEVAGKTVNIGGMCKGAGMIHPQMATMLCYVTTDAAIEESFLQVITKEIVEDTFNMISVDGDTSTNDTCIVLANGLAENETISNRGSEGFKEFYEGLHYVLCELSKKIAGDGEGATCLFEVQVNNAVTKNDARVLSKAVVCSNLTKAAIFGHDANWGRILCAMGYSGAEFDPEIVDVWFESAAGKLKIVENGAATDYSEEIATKILSEKHVTAIVDAKQGEYSATAYGCDLTFDYVTINADYRS